MGGGPGASKGCSCWQRQGRQQAPVALAPWYHVGREQFPESWLLVDGPGGVAAHVKDLPNGKAQHFPTVAGTNRGKQLVHVSGAWQSPGLVTAEQMNQWATALCYGHAEVPSIFLLFLPTVHKMQPHKYVCVLNDMERKYQLIFDKTGHEKINAV